MATNVHGCRLAPDGAVPAMPMSASMAARGTGRSEKWRTLRRRGLSPEAAARLMREMRQPESPETLTERETDVLRLLAQGKANKEIARALTIGEQTVKTHVSNILGKLGVQSRTQAALHAARIGLVTPQDLQRER